MCSATHSVTLKVSQPKGLKFPSLVVIFFFFFSICLVWFCWSYCKWNSWTFSRGLQSNKSSECVSGETRTYNETPPTHTNKHKNFTFMTRIHTQGEMMMLSGWLARGQRLHSWRGKAGGGGQFWKPPRHLKALCERAVWETLWHNFLGHGREACTLCETARQEVDGSLNTPIRPHVYFICILRYCLSPTE